MEQFKKPEYYFQPALAIRRLLSGVQIKEGLVDTAFGTQIFVNPQELIGQNIAKSGIYDLVLSEMLYRLIQQGDNVIDVGANIGFMSQIMSKKVGIEGKVYCFEPNPLILNQLDKNLTLGKKGNNILLYKTALSDYTGTASLNLPDGYEINTGLAKLTVNGKKDDIAVDVDILDNVLHHKRQRFSVLKIDAEGHEEAILKGAHQLLSAKLVTNILYEDFDAYPTETSRLLQYYGYTIFRLEKGWFKPNLVSPFKPVKPLKEALNYLATLDVSKLKISLRSWGYQCLRK